MRMLLYNMFSIHRGGNSVEIVCGVMIEGKYQKSSPLDAAPRH